MKKKRVLIVEDDEIFRRFLKDHLSNKPGLKVVGEAEDGRKALEQAETLKPDLVLMDSRMPKLNGFKASRLLLDKMPHLRIIILAVFNNPKDKQAAEECGACGYVQKLNIMEELLPAIRAAFRASGNGKMPIKKKAERPKRMPGASRPPYQQHPDPEKVERLLQASLESEHKYKSLVDKSLLGIYMTQNHILKFCNSRFAEMFNYPGPEAMIGLHIRKLVAPESWDTVDREVKLRESGQKEFSQYEFRAIRRDGSRFEAEVLGNRIQYEGQPAVQGMMIDITERKRSERLRNCLFRISEAAAASSTLDDLFHSIHLNIAELMPANNFYIALFDADGQTISFPYFRDEFDTAPARNKPGQGLTEYVLRTGEPLLASPDVFNELERSGDVESMGTPSLDWLGVPLKIEGQARGVLVVQSYTRGVRYTEADKAILMFVSDQVAQAIARKQAESAMQDRERFLAGILDSIPDGISVLGLDFTILRVNQTIEEWYAHARPLAGKKCYETYHLRKTVCDICPTRKTLLTSKAAFEVVPKVGPGGEAVGWLGLYSFPFVDQASGRMKGVIEYAHDITEQKRAEEQIRLEEARLQSLYNISQAKVKDMGDLWDFALEEAISLTGSKIGWLGAYHAERQTLKVISWSREVMTDSRIKDRPTEFPIEKGGIWAEAIWSGEPLVINDYKADDSRKKGYPSGHLELIRLLAMPILAEDNTIYLLVAANKEQDYDATDIRQLTLLMDSVLKITERKKAEEALRESEEKYRVLVENLNDVIYTIKAGGTITFVSPTVQAVLGYTPTELIGTDFNLLILPDDLDRIRRAFGEILGGQLYPSEYRMFTKSGEVRWVHTSSRPIYKEGRAVGLQGVLTDITERRQAEEALHHSEEQYRTLVESLNEVIISLDLEGKFDYVSPAVERIFQYKVFELIGKPFAQFIHPDDLPDLMYRFSEALKGETRPYVFRILDKDGEIKFIRTHSQPIMKEGKPAGLTALLEDVTKRKRAEEALKKSEERFKLLFAFAPDAYFLLDLNGRLLDSNNAAQVLTGHKQEEAAGRTFIDLRLLPPSQKENAAALMEKNIMGLPTGPDEMVLSRQDGTEIQVEIRTFPIKVEGAIQILWIARDVAGRKALENEADKRIAELEEFYKMAVNRELRMIELKNEIEKLNAELARLGGGLEKRV